MLGAAVSITVVLVLFIGMIILQVYLSKKNSKWYGLIIPLIFLLFSLVNVLSMSSYTEGDFHVTVRDESGAIIEEIQGEQSTVEDRPGAGEMIVKVAAVFLVSNILTIMMLLIYFVCRGKNRRRNELAKMSVQDLE